jgi:hypothetical protein
LRLLGSEHRFEQPDATTLAADSLTSMELTLARFVAEAPFVFRKQNVVKDSFVALR